MVLVKSKYKEYNNNKVGGSNRKGVIRKEPTVDEIMDKIERLAHRERREKQQQEKEIKQLREVNIRNDTSIERDLRGYVGVITNDNKDKSAYVDNYVPSTHGAKHARTSNNTTHALLPRNVIKQDD
mgnify:CR=1 FL=1